MLSCHWHVRAGKMACSQELQQSRPAIAAPAKAKTGWVTCICYISFKTFDFFAGPSWEPDLPCMNTVTIPNSNKSQSTKLEETWSYRLMFFVFSSPHHPTPKHPPPHPSPSPLTAHKRPTDRQLSTNHRPPATNHQHQPVTTSTNHKSRLPYAICKHKSEFPRRCSTPLPKWEFPHQHSHHFGLEGKL